MCTSVQSYDVSTAFLAHLGNLLRSPISIGSKIKSYRPDGNRMLLSEQFVLSLDTETNKKYEAEEEMELHCFMLLRFPGYK